MTHGDSSLVSWQRTGYWINTQRTLLSTFVALREGKVALPIIGNATWPPDLDLQDNLIDGII